MSTTFTFLRFSEWLISPVRGLSQSLCYIPAIYLNTGKVLQKKFYKKLQTQEILQVVKKQNSLNTEQQKVDGIGKGTLNWDLLGASIYHWLRDIITYQMFYIFHLWDRFLAKHWAKGKGKNVFATSPKIYFLFPSIQALLKFSVTC